MPEFNAGVSQGPVCEKGQGGTRGEAVTVLIPVIYCNQPRTMKQNTNTVQDFSLQASHPALCLYNVYCAAICEYLCETS